jgi:hypothetical protein
MNLPTLFRATLNLDKFITPSTLWSMQFMYFENLSEIGFFNININQPTSHLEGPDARLIHAPTDSLKIPINQNGTNPYDHIIQIKNTNGQTGYGYEMSFQLKHQQEQSSSLIKYLYGKAYSIYDGNYSIALNHWKLTEQTNGRNQISLSTSDFSQGHRVYAEYQIQIKQKKNKRFTGSIHYNGQSGAAFSFVYGKGNCIRRRSNHYRI